MLWVVVVFALARVAAALPGGVIKTVELTGMTQVVDVEPLPDGRLLLVSRLGTVNLYDAGPKAKSVYLHLTTFSKGETGFMDLALDPNFSSNHYFYCYYCGSDGHFRVSRFQHAEMGGGTSSVGLVQSEVELWVDVDDAHDFIPKHYGGQISFGPNGHLYVTQGDKWNKEYAQTQRNDHYNKPSNSGCIIRINKGERVLPTGIPQSPVIITPCARTSHQMGASPAGTWAMPRASPVAG